MVENTLLEVYSAKKKSLPVLASNYFILLNVNRQPRMFWKDFISGRPTEQKGNPRTPGEKCQSDKGEQGRYFSGGGQEYFSSALSNTWKF